MNPHPILKKETGATRAPAKYCNTKHSDCGVRSQRLLDEIPLGLVFTPSPTPVARRDSGAEAQP